MSAPFLKLLSALVATLSLVPTVAAVPIPISSPTAIALIVYMSVVPVLLILLLIVKYLYVKYRRADAASGHALSSNSSFQLRMWHRCGRRTIGSDWDITRTALLVGLFGSPDWEIKMKEADHSTVVDTNSQFSCAALLPSKPDLSGHISLGSFPPDTVRPLILPVSATSSACSVGWVVGLQG